MWKWINELVTCWLIHFYICFTELKIYHLSSFHHKIDLLTEKFVIVGWVSNSTTLGVSLINWSPYGTNVSGMSIKYI